MDATSIVIDKFDIEISQWVMLSHTKSAADFLIRTDFENEDQGEEIDGSEESESDSDDLYILEEPSRSDLPCDNNMDFDDVLSSGLSYSETQEDQEDDGETEERFDDVLDDSWDAEREDRGGELNDTDDTDVIDESDYMDDEQYGNGDSESGSESTTPLSEVYPADTYQFYNQSLEYMGIIAALLLFIVATIILKYIYKFFKLFF